MEFPRTRALLESAVADRATPAAVIEVGTARGAQWTGAFGALTYDADAPPTTAGTIFDLASLTKVIVTTSLTMQHVAAGRLALSTRVADLFPEWTDAPHAAITVRHLLDHSSGLAAHARIWERHRGRREYARTIHEEPLERAPGVASVYSDLGFLMLGFMVEHAGHSALDEQFARLAASWGVDLDFFDFRPGPGAIGRIAPTEFDVWRGRLLQGEVHDENAAALDGVAGHAGLFGTASDVGTFARLVLRSFNAQTALAAPVLMRQFAAPTDVPGSSRALGWDTMRSTSSCGTRCSPSAIGHTGFTGTSLWIDPEQDRYVVLLTNRVYPTRENQALVTRRPRIHDAVAQDLLERNRVS